MRTCRISACRPGLTRFRLIQASLLQRWNAEVAPAIVTDHVTLRRLLVDYGEVERTADGARYRVGYPARPVAFDLEIDEIDVRATIAAYVDHQARKRAERP